MQTGATVEALTGLLAIGKFNNVGAEQLGGAMNKLASNLAGATEESKGAGKALETLGINFNQFKGMRPEEQIKAVADAMAQFEDGSGKSAVAMALFGKQGAQLLPFFHDLAEAGDLQAKMTTEQAAAAANLDDNLVRLTTSGDAWKKELVAGMVPALDLGAQAMLDVMNGSGGIRAEVKRLVADGSIREWTKPIIVTSGYRAPAVNKAVGGVATSDHTQGMAADIVAPAWGTPLQIARALAPLVGALGIGQLIYEHVGGKAWVHISTRLPDKPANRVITISGAGTQLGIKEA